MGLIGIFGLVRAGDNDLAVWSQHSNKLAHHFMMLSMVFNRFKTHNKVDAGIRKWDMTTHSMLKMYIRSLIAFSRIAYDLFGSIHPHHTEGNFG